MKGRDVEALIQQARERGLTVTERHCGPVSGLPIAAAEDSEPAKIELLPSGHLPPNVWVVGVETRSESNQRFWKARSGRTQKARRAVSRLFGRTLRDLVPFAEWFHAGKNLRIRFTRLAPHKLDVGNLSSAMKATEDGLATAIGGDDGAANGRQGGTVRRTYQRMIAR